MLQTSKLCMTPFICRYFLRAYIWTGHIPFGNVCSHQAKSPCKNPKLKGSEDKARTEISCSFCMAEDSPNTALHYRASCLYNLILSCAYKSPIETAKGGYLQSPSHLLAFNLSTVNLRESEVWLLARSPRREFVPSFLLALTILTLLHFLLWQVLRRKLRKTPR